MKLSTLSYGYWLFRNNYEVSVKFFAHFPEFFFPLILDYKNVQIAKFKELYSKHK